MITKRRQVSKEFEEDKNKQESDFFNDFSDNNAQLSPPEKSIPKTAQNEKSSSTVLQRVKTGFSIFGSFILLILMGQFYCSLLVLVIQIGFFREIINIKRSYMREAMIKSTTYLVWFLFLTGLVYFYFWNFDQILVRSQNKFLSFTATFRNSLFFGVYLVFFVLFVISLRFGYIRYQVRLFVETHITLLVAGIVGCAMVVIYEGTIWFLAAALAVILNDCFAYLAGMTFGRHKLIDLSPKKTLEGFIGGAIGTVISVNLV